MVAGLILHLFLQLILVSACVRFKEGPLHFHKNRHCERSEAISHLGGEIATQRKAGSAHRGAQLAVVNNNASEISGFEEE